MVNPCRLACVLLLISAVGLQAADDRPVIGWQGRTMGTVYSVQIAGTNLNPSEISTLRTEVESRLNEVNRQMSHYLPDSELSRFNRAPAGVPFKVSAEFATVVRFSLDLAQRSEGAFDPTIGPLINLWGFGEKGETRAVPEDANIKTAMNACGWRHLQVTDRDELVKDLPELTINLGAVAKGFGVDQIAKLLRGHGLTNVYVSIAGDLLALGRSPRGGDWHVGIAAPVEHWTEDDPMQAVVSLSDRALSTSGDYQKFFTDAAGRRLSHIIDPQTGRPVQHNLGSVSVVATNSMTADALGTTLFVLGPERGYKFIESWTNAAALFIIREPNGELRQMRSSRFPETQ